MFKLNFGNRYVEYIKTEKNSHKKKKKKKTEKTCTVCERVCLPAHSRFDIRTVCFFRGSKTSWAYVGELG